MNQCLILVKRELSQYIREFKIVWLPLVFMLLGITQPISYHFMPQILSSLSGGSGISIDTKMFVQSSGEVLASTLNSQFDQLGIIIIVISLMGTVFSEKLSDMISFILTRPVSATSYLFSKILSNFFMVALSVILGYIVSAYYSNLYYTDINIVRFSLALLCYMVWILFVVSFITMLSIVLKSQGSIAIAGVIILLLLKYTSGINKFIDIINPSNMSANAANILINGEPKGDMFLNLIVTFFAIMVIIYISKFWILNKKYQ